MSLPGEVTLPWGDGRHPFCLPIGQVRELEEKRGVGSLTLARRISNGDWFFDDLRETIRLGLIGGGKTPVEALKLVEQYIDVRPPAENVPTAYAILLAFINGVPKPSKKKPQPMTAKGTETRPEESTSTPSTASAPQ